MITNAKNSALPNFVEIARTTTEIWRFQFFKMAAVHHFGFVTRMLGPPTKGIWWSLSLWLELISSSFDNMRVFDFASLA